MATNDPEYFVGSDGVLMRRIPLEPRSYYHDGYYDTERTISGGIDMVSGEWHPVATEGDALKKALEENHRVYRNMQIQKAHRKCLRKRKNRNV
jgi:hypothetical protein